MKKKGHVRIVDIAKELNVTPSTVSRALNGGGKIGEKTRKAVLELAEKWGYRPNPLAKSLLKKETKTLGLIIPEFTHYFFSVVLAGIESVTYPKGYRLVICTSDGSYEKEKEACLTLTDARVDGLLMSLSVGTNDFEHILAVQDLGVPVVFFDRISEDIDAPYVITDDFDGAFKAVEHLILSGCKKIAHIKGPHTISTTFNRYMGYVEALKKHNLPIINEYILEDTKDKEANREALLNILEGSEGIDAIFAFSDYHAFDAMQVIKEKGLSIPEDISVIGYADEPLSSYVTPQMTTIKQPAFEMGQQAAKYLLTLLNDKGAVLSASMLKTSLVLRESTKHVV